MNFIEKLLDGVTVEWKTLGDIATLRRGRVMSKGYFVDNVGEYPVYSSQTVNNGMIGRIDTFDFEDNLLFRSSTTRSFMLFISLGSSILLNIKKRLFQHFLKAV